MTLALLPLPSKNSASSARDHCAKSSDCASRRLWLLPLPTSTGVPNWPVIWVTALAVAALPPSAVPTAAARLVASDSRLAPAPVVMVCVSLPAPAPVPYSTVMCQVSLAATLPLKATAAACEPSPVTVVRTCGRVSAPLVPYSVTLWIVAPANRRSSAPSATTPSTLPVPSTALSVGSTTSVLPPGWVTMSCCVSLS